VKGGIAFCLLCVQVGGWVGIYIYISVLSLFTDHLCVCVCVCATLGGIGTSCIVIFLEIDSIIAISSAFEGTHLPVLLFVLFGTCVFHWHYL